MVEEMVGEPAMVSMDRFGERAAEAVQVGDQLLNFSTVARYMDPALLLEAMEWAGHGATAQAIVDEYVRLHRRRYGDEFVQPTV
jgi:hypothetical protein